MSANERLLTKVLKGPVHMMQGVWPHLAKKPSPPFHYEMNDALIRHDINLLNMVAPRGFAKSTIMKIYVLWHLFVQDAYYKHVLRKSRPIAPKFVYIGSKTRSHSLAFLDDVFDLMDGEKYPLFKAGLGHSYIEEEVRRSGGTVTKEEIMIPHIGTLIARGASQPVRGLNRRGTRLTLPLWDDPEDENNTKTIEAILNNRKIFFKGVMPAVDREIGDKAVCIGTPQSEEGLVNFLEKAAKKKDSFHSMRFSAITEEGKSLWPEMWSIRDLEAERKYWDEMGMPSMFASEYLCQLVSDERVFFRRYGLYRGAVIEKNGLHYMRITHRSPVTEHTEERELVELDEPLLRAVSLQGGVDPAISTARRADRTTIVITARTAHLDDVGTERYVLPMIAGRFRATEVSLKIMQQDKRYHPRVWRIEEHQYQAMLRQTLQEKGMHNIVKTKVSQQKKEMRLEGMDHIFSIDDLYILEEHELLRQEMGTFGSPSGHDDTLDGLYYSDFNSLPPHHTVAQFKDHTPLQSYFLRRERSGTNDDWMTM